MTDSTTRPPELPEEPEGIRQFRSFVTFATGTGEPDGIAKELLEHIDALRSHVASLNERHATALSEAREQMREECAMVCEQSAASVRVMIAKNLANNDRLTAIALNRELNAHTRDATRIRSLPSLPATTKEG